MMTHIPNCDIPKTGVLSALAVRCFVLATTAAVLFNMPQHLQAHAGHDDIPEASVATVGELDPRFYARSEQIDATIILGEPGAPVELYLVDHNTNQPISGEVRAEQITPDLAELKIQEGGTSGVYQLSGLTDLSSTATITVEVSSGDLFDVLSFNNIIRPAAGIDDVDATAGTVVEAVQAAVPKYLIQALAAANALVVILLILVFLKYLLTRRKKEMIEKTSIAVLVAFSFIGVSERAAHAHAGDTHAGEGLASVGAVAGAGGRHFVTVETQLRGGIETTAVQQLELPESFPALGRVTTRPDREAAITAPADGMLLSGPGRETVPIAGDRVEKGELLVQLQMIIPAEDKVTISSEKVLAEADLKQAQQETLLAAQELERAVKLASWVSQSEVDKLKTEYQVAREREQGLRGRIATLDAALQGETSGVKTLEIRAPIDGIISESHSTLGEYVTVGKALFRIINIDEVFVEADVFESDLRTVENARRARIFVEAYPNRTFTGELHRLSPEIDPMTRTARAVFNVKNEENLLKSGMFASVSIETGDPRPVLVVPKTAVVSQEALKQVYVKVAPEIYDAVPVSVARYVDQYAVLEPGSVEEGDVVVTQGQYQVRMSPVVGAAE